MIEWFTGLLERFESDFEQYKWLGWDNILQHPHTNERNWEYRGFNNIKVRGFKNKPRSTVEEQKISNEDVYFERYGKKPKLIRMDRWLNMVEYTCDSKKIENANVMRDAREYIKNVSNFG